MPNARITRIEAAETAEKMYIIFEEMVTAGFTREEAIKLLAAVSRQ